MMDVIDARLLGQATQRLLEGLPGVLGPDGRSRDT